MTSTTRSERPGRRPPASAHPSAVRSPPHVHLPDPGLPGMGAVVATIGAALVVVGALLAFVPVLSAVEQSALRALNGLPVWAGRPLAVLAAAGSFLAIPAAAVVAVVAARHRAALDLIAAGLITWVVVQGLLKPLIGRPRPAELLAEVMVRDQTAVGLGFPSGHAAVAGALAVAAGPWLPRSLRWAAWGVVAAVAAARLYAGVHLLGDVIAGIGVGMFLGGLWRLLPRGHGR